MLKRTVVLVALLNFAYFWVEFGVANFIDAVSLFSDSIDFLEDTAVNLLVLLALGWSRQRRAFAGMALACTLLVPGMSALWAAWHKVGNPVPPDALLLSITGAGALFVNALCAWLLAHFRQESGSLVKAAFLSARNDAFANILIIGAGLMTAFTLSAWPDLIVGLGIFLMNLDSAGEVFEAARKERNGDGKNHAP